ncbi:fused response regulator/thioredoxin-disulfide reductase [Mycolicibacterium celeriflavum]|uniref:Fused response regulator/thioredoxin-disulfide reductase n=1 Tax=Mycolicibacterium celeriflavum TaxID=1249101 RepID=A0A1X0BYD4_MYCCF|nr:FAD-dependent oxidoreductase [Mycolicibacterium celeriflavum]MCV7236797.1 FAD-dependent oxidoreductase [Mycolicibacterium celeriflavum]OBG21877.1 fused response regulator/thioredoxin-disulfide reductase [Mycolicibacterium celeriflavum]ORA49553.1 fused response regulator/thioredoxin-disulfide reductase [Mycolicibacterium celeriflavum]BBY43957.1 fused response regulator/thioredoxin-disulfide reductase [Mycolicibacterium celeriflavum]
MTGPTPQPRKPVILSVDDDPAVSRAVARDLRRHYGENFRIVRAESGPDALETLNELKLRGETVAVFVADYRMPQMSGIDFLEEAMDIYPMARRVLLTAYADTHAAIDAINVVDLDHYLLKPWDPPEEKLYPVLDALIEAWRETGDRAIPHTKVIGHRWNERSWQVRQFLARNQHSFRSFMADEQKGKQLLDAAGLDEFRLPVVISEQGETLVEPSDAELAAMLGLSTDPTLELYDLAVIGGGPAGLAAAVYGASEGLNTVLIEETTTGGQAGRSSRIENYLGFPTGISGAELTTSARRQAERFGAEVITTRKAVRLHADDSGSARTIEFADGGAIAARAVILATGVAYRQLRDVPGCWDDPNENACNYIGRGVFYGASVSDSAECEGEDVYIVGGANSAGQAAIYMSEKAKSVTLLVRGPSLAASMSHYLVERIEKNPKISVRTCTEVVDTVGEDDHLAGLVLLDKQTGATERVNCDRMCCFIGAEPRTDWLDLVAKDDHGFILSGPDVTKVAGWTLDRPPHHLETSVPGVFVAGDVRSESAKRVAAAVGEGSMAVMLVHRYLAEA